MYIAHVIPERKQFLTSHLLNVAQLSEENCPLDILKNLVWLNGMLHDCGKVCEEFQDYMKDISQYGEKARKRKIDHSTAGGQIIESIKKGSLCGKMISTAVYSHHGVQNCVDIQTGITLSEVRKSKCLDLEKILKMYFGFVNRELLESRFQMALDDIRVIWEQIEGVVNVHGKQYGHSSFYLGMYERLLISILIDNDWKDTASFFDGVALPKQMAEKETQEIWEKSVEYFEEYLKTLQ